MKKNAVVKWMIF